MEHHLGKFSFSFLFFSFNKITLIFFFWLFSEIKTLFFIYMRNLILTSVNVLLYDIILFNYICQFNKDVPLLLMNSFFVEYLFMHSNSYDSVLIYY